MSLHSSPPKLVRECGIRLLMMALAAISPFVAQLIYADTLAIHDQLLITSSPDHHEVLIANATNTSSPILRSSDGSYAWLFVPYQNNNTRLLVVLSTAFNTTIVWIANRNHPVSPNASLLVQMPSRSLVLRDENGSIAWSPPVAGVHTVLMNSTGNLIIYDARNVSIWQSYDNASDVLLPGQIVRTNHSVISRLSIEDVSEGHYTLRVEPGGAVLYATFDWQQQKIPYAVVNYVGSPDIFGSTSLDIALHSACNHTNLIYKEGSVGVGLQQEGSDITPQCKVEVGNVAADAHGIDFGTRLGNPGFRYLRLMPYGDIDTFVSDANGVALDNEFFGGMLNTYCKLPSYCGVNSLCSSRNSCTCPTMFDPINPFNMRLGCRLKDALNCSISTQHQFLALTGVDYYANAHITPHIVTGPNECQSLCRANCSCTAAFYRNASHECHLYDQVQTMQPGALDVTSITAFLRVAKLPVTAQPTNKGIPRKVIIGAATSVAAVLVILVLLVGWIGRRVMMTKPEEESDLEEEAFLESLPGLPPRFSYKDLHSATEGFSKKLGAGGSGAVYEGYILPADAHRNYKLKNTATQEHLLKVAVKELQLSKFATIAASGKKQFRAEVATLGNLSHVNLVQLRGFCAEGAHRLLIYEFLENGSLDRWIFNRQMTSGLLTTLTWEVRYRIAVATARGLAFLHEGSRDKVVHLDVKPQNILLDESFQAKLADFGLCKLVERDAGGGGAAGESQTVTAMRGTPGYMAPEWFLNLPVTDRSDVFSYGMVLLELVGGRKNLNLAAGSEDEWYFPAWAVRQAENGNLLNVIDKKLNVVPDVDQSSSAMCAAMTRLLHVAFWCIQENAMSRPSMSTVLLMLEDHLQVPDPPLDRTYILRRQSRPAPTLNSTSTSSVSMGSSAPASGIVSELEPR